MIKINIGCGMTPLPGWRNFDNSLSLRLAKTPTAIYFLGLLGFLNKQQQEFIDFARNNNIEYGDATKTLPIASEAVDIIYTSHMLEHLDRSQADNFFKESRRLLRPGGIIRIIVPDLRIMVDEYLADKDSTVFLDRMLLCSSQLTSLGQRLKFIVTGLRHHLWMYDAKSLSEILIKHGFTNITVQPAGSTLIEDYYPINLHERSSESIYLEAVQPSSIINQA
jgi:SAM-dependent methyltransferase